jgi:hypothetical protein
MTNGLVRKIVCAVALFMSIPAFSQQAPFFTGGNLVVVVEGCGAHGGTCTNVPNGTGTGTGNSSHGGYGDNQAAPLTLFQYTPTGTTSVSFVNSLVLPQTASGANLSVSGEYGSSSEGTLNLSSTGNYLALMGYGIGAATFNASPTTYGPADAGALAQSTSVPGQAGVTPIPRVLSLIDANGDVNSSTAIFNIFNENNPRSAFTANGTTAYVSGQGVTGDATGGVFYVPVGVSNSAPTSIVGADAGGTASQDTRDVEIYNNTLYVSMDSKSGSYNRSYVGTLGSPPSTSVYSCGSGCPSGDGTIGPGLLTGLGNTGGTGKVTITSGSNSNGNGLNSGAKINLSPVNYFFASPSVLYVADSGDPKNDSNGGDCSGGADPNVGDGGLQKWVNSSSNGTGTWTLEYTLYQGLNIVSNCGTTGTTGLYGLAGVVSGSVVHLYATNYTLNDLDYTYLYGITDTLSNTTPPGSSLVFTLLDTAPSDSNFKGVAFAPVTPAGSVEVTTSPSGLTFTSAGTGCAPGTYTSPVVLAWTPGSSCTLSVATPQAGGTGTQYAFSEWEDGTTGTSHIVTAPTGTANYSATFNTQYRLTTAAGTGGTVSAGGYYNSGSSATVTATPSSGYYFVNFTGTATSTSNPFAVLMSGPQSITANFAAESNQTITFTTNAPSSAVYGSTFTVAATGGGSGNPVVFTSNGSCTNSGATYTMISGTGTCSVIANQAGNADYFAAPTVTQTTNATPASQTITLSGVPASAAYGQSFTIGASGGASGNAVVLTSDGVVCTNSGTTYTMISGSGNCSVIANQAGNSNYSAAPQVTDLVAATTATSSTSVASSLEPSVYGQSVTFTATITGQYGAVRKNAKTRVKSQVVGGSVTWNDSNGAIVCSESGSSTTTVTNGSAACTLSTLPVSADTITGTYSGDSGHTGSSGSVVQNITAAGASVSVASSLDPSTYGQTVVFTATISGEYGLIRGHKKQVATGSVAWSDANGSMSCVEGNPSTVASGAATCTVSNLAVNASDTITANYSGDSNHNPSSGTVSQEIDAAGASVVVASSGSPSNLGQPVTLTATISGQYGLLKKKGNKAKSQDVSGTVLWSSNTGCGTTSVTSGNPGTATCITSILQAGSNTVTASYSGDSDHNPGSGSFTQVVSSGTTSINVTSVSPASEDYGADSPVTITAVLSWTGNGPAPTASDVTIGGNGPSGYSATGCGAASGNTITCSATYTPTTADGPGSYTESASFSGDSNYGASSSSQGNNFTINTASSTTSVQSSANPSTYGQSLIFTATINGENGNVRGSARRAGAKRQVVTGSVTWSTNTGCGTTTVTSGNPGVATCTTSSATRLPVGTDTITATYSGDSNHSGSTGTLNQQVNGGVATTISVTSISPASENYGADTPVTITAVLSWTGHGAEPTLANVTIGGNGNGTYGSTSCGSRSGDTVTCTATYTPTTADGAGSYTETAAFSGDTNYSASSSSQTNNFTINAATSSTTVGSSANPSNYGTSVTFTATVTGANGAVRRNGVKSQDITGSVTWSSNTGCATSTVSGYPGVATCQTSSLNAGTDSVVATYSGDGSHSGSSGSVNQTVNKADQTITATPPAEVLIRDSFTVSASGGGSGNALVFTSSGDCTNSGDVYTMGSKLGTCTGTINQAGNSNYNAAAAYTWNTTAITKSVVPAVTLTGAPATAVGGTSFTVTATYPNTQGVPVETPTITGGTTCSVGALSGSGTTYQATVTMLKGSGTCTITAKWPANYYYAAGTATEKTTAEETTPTTSFTGAPTSAIGGSTFTVTASSNETGAYASTPTITGGSVCSVGTVTSNGPGSYQATVTMLKGSGTCTTKAVWAKTIEYAAVTDEQETTATVITPSVTFTGAPTSASNGSTFAVTASSNETGAYAAVPTITVAGGDCTVGSVSNAGPGTYQATVTMTKATGTCTTTAKWAATIEYATVSAIQKTTASE